MKALVGAFNQEKALVELSPSRGLLRNCTTTPINRFAALVLTALPRKDALADFDYVTSVDAVTFSASLLPPPFSSSHIITLLSTNWPGRRQ